MHTSEILDAAETAALLHAEAETIMQLARSGTLPGTRIGKAWIFLREDVMAFLREQIARDTAERRRLQAALAPCAVMLAPPSRRSRRTVVPPLPDLPPVRPNTSPQAVSQITAAQAGIAQQHPQIPVAGNLGNQHVR